MKMLAARMRADLAETPSFMLGIMVQAKVTAKGLARLATEFNAVPSN